MKERTWYFEGQTFISPTFKQEGKPYQINGAIKEAWLNSLPKVKPLSLTEKIGLLLNPFSVPKRFKKTNSLFESEDEDSLEETIKEQDETEKKNEEFDLESIEEEYVK
jgi:hypothetical protein